MRLHRALVLRLALWVACTLALARPAHAQSVYIAGGSNQFGTLNLQTGVFSYINSFAFSNSLNKMAGMVFDTNGNLYGVDLFAEMYQISTATGALKDLGSLGIDGAVSATMQDGKMLVMDEGDANNGVTNQIFSVDLATLTPTLVGDTNLFADGLFASDGQGHIYAGERFLTDTDTDTLHQVNPTTGGATQIGATGYLSIGAGVFTNDKLYAFGSDASGKLSVLSLNTTTGAATFVVRYSIRAPGVPGGIITAAAARPLAPVPELGEIVQFAGLSVLGLIGLKFRAFNRPA